MSQETLIKLATFKPEQFGAFQEKARVLIEKEQQNSTHFAADWETATVQKAAGSSLKQNENKGGHSLAVSPLAFKSRQDQSLCE